MTTLTVGELSIPVLNAADDKVTLVESWDEAVGTPDEHLGRRYEMVNPGWTEEPKVIHLTDDYLFALVRRYPGVYGCRHSDVMLEVVS